MESSNPQTPPPASSTIFLFRVRAVIFLWSDPAEHNPQSSTCTDRRATARDPASSADGQSLAFVRDDHGRGRLIERPGTAANSAADVELTPPALNVFEASFHSPANYAFAASEPNRPPQIYLTSAAGANVALGLGESRYPAISPDGHWLAYSRFDRGAWNLWVRDQSTGATKRIGNVPCNEIQPSWESDSRTLLYSTDCGRSLGFTAVARRRVIP
jgi:hypothetical protein